MAQPPLRHLDESIALGVGRQLCELSAHVQAAQAELALRLAAFDDDAGWGGAGIRSCCHWLSIQAGLDYHTSSDLLHVGHALAELPLIRGAFSAEHPAPSTDLPGPGELRQVHQRPSSMTRVAEWTRRTYSSPWTR